jgi:hypothetical protein
MTDDDWADPNREERLIVTALPGSRVEVVEQSHGRLVLFIPGGGFNANALGCFAIIWNSFVGFFLAVFVTAWLRQKNPPWGPVAILSLFVLAGLGLAYYAIRLKFERTLLFVERDRAALRRTLFGRTRTEEVKLENESVAALAMSYEQNDQPVYAITLNGIGKMLRFGTALSDTEKEWVVDRVNEIIGARAPDQAKPLIRHLERCVQCGGSLGSAAEANAQDELTCPFCGHVHRGEILSLAPVPLIRKPSDAEPQPEDPFPDKIIRIVDQSPDRLEFWMRSTFSIGVSIGLAILFGFFAAFWNGITWTFVLNILRAPGFAKVFPLLFMIPFVLIGAASVLGIIYVLFGYEWVRIDRERVRGKWGVGPFGYTRTIPTAEVERVTLEAAKTPNTANQSRVRVDKQYTAYIRSVGKGIPMGIIHETNTAAHIAQLVRNQFATMGVLVEQKPDPNQKERKKNRRRK